MNRSRILEPNRTITTVLLIIAGVASAPAAEPVRSLDADFDDPPMEVRPSGYWWWLYNNVDKVSITRDLEQFRDKGLGAVLLVCSGNWSASPLPKGPQFLSDEWNGLFLHDYRKTIADCMADEHYRRFAELSKAYGMKIRAEAAGPLVVTPCESPLAKRKPKAGSESQPELF